MSFYLKYLCFCLHLELVAKQKHYVNNRKCLSQEFFFLFCLIYDTEDSHGNFLEPKLEKKKQKKINSYFCSLKTQDKQKHFLF